MTIHAWWNRLRAGRRLLIEQSVNEWLYMLDTAFADAVVEMIMVGAWTREDCYENMHAMPIHELLGLRTASAVNYHLPRPLAQALVNLDIRFVGELINCTADELADLTDRLTPTEIQKIRLKLGKYGLALKGEHPIPELLPAEL